MLSKYLLGGAAAMLLAANAHAATDAPSGYTKCVQNTGATCSFSGTRSVALGKSGSFVYGTFTNSVVCSSSNFPSNTFTSSAWCSYAGTTTSSSSSSVAASSSSSSSSVASSVASSSSSSKSSSSSSVASSSVASSSVASSVASTDPYVTGCGTETSNLTASKVYYVTPSGSASGAGTSFSAPMSLTAAISKVSAGQMILLQSGTYAVPYTAGAKNTITLSQSGTSSAKIYMVAANCGRAKIDFQWPTNTWLQDSYGFSLTGSYWYFKGIDVTRAGYQGAYVTGAYNTFENVAFYNNRNSGLEINKGGSYTKVINVDSYNNYDPKKNGSMADGFASKQTQGAGNFFYGCRAWSNSDDGFDTFDSPQAVTIEKSWAFSNGINIYGDSAFAGNGNGFKLGGNGAVQRNVIKNSVAFGHPGKGFDQNNNTGGVTLYNNTGYKNKINFSWGGTLASGEKNILKNNASLSGTSADVIANATSTNNTWNSITTSSSDFASVDTSLATAARNADGSLPNNSLFRLSSSSNLIDKGVNVGIAYKGGAPDLGAFELK
ncbi:right-handed parallel beta-helix repeat-containing protein [Uliginosibacterium sp. H3]|uniref:Right-handed parallel beta-helix repeat-containing protein n=1 Tax=Uliginosibacterium silvisoli TaxID=3114758 RepID=A0ABU6K588_9RHOO|nr:right-handed parallel beta-helix repeat-containing protein [Uliginosibacterium sp. H3]